MCSGVEVSEEGKRWEIYAPSHIAALPVWIEGRLEWITWGRREGEDGESPEGGWLTEDEATNTTFRSQRGLVYALRFLVDNADTPKSDYWRGEWHEVPEGYALDCVVLRSRGQRAAYIVTCSTSELPANGRWPRLIRASSGQER
jgi:hypothetical protein